MKWTGLTGGIATGKTTAKKLIEGLGIPVIDADQISHKLTEVDKPAYKMILSHFGQSVLNEDLSLNRKKLAGIIFNESKQKAVLESILHPLIQAEVLKQKNKFESQKIKLCFYDLPLLFEKNLERSFDCTVLIWCDPNAQLNRLMNRNSLSATEAQLRISNQLQLIDKVKRANYCIDNSGEIDDLTVQIKTLVRSLIQ